MLLLTPQGLATRMASCFFQCRRVWPVECHYYYFSPTGSGQQDDIKLLSAPQGPAGRVPSSFLHPHLVLLAGWHHYLLGLAAFNLFSHLLDQIPNQLNYCLFIGHRQSTQIEVFRVDNLVTTWFHQIIPKFMSIPNITQIPAIVTSFHSCFLLFPYLLWYQCSYPPKTLDYIISTALLSSWLPAYSMQSEQQAGAE